MMNKKFLNMMISAILLGVLLSSCTSTVGGASSWPGLTVADGTGFFAYGTQVYALDLKNGGLIWKYPAEASNSRQFYAVPEVGSNLVIVGDYSKTLAAVDRQSGAEKWKFDKADDRYIGSALIANGVIYAPNTDHYLYALDENGGLLWRFKATGANWTKPVTDNQYLYFASMDHSVYALDLQYSSSALSADKDGSLKLVAKPDWSLDLSAAIVSNPVLADGIMYVGTVDGHLYAIDVAAKEVKWSFNGDGKMASIWGTPVLTANSVFVGDEDGNVFAVNKSDGKALWPEPFAAGSAVISSGITVDSKVIFASNAGKIFTIDESKNPNTLVTLEATLYSPLGYDGDKIIVAPATKDKLFLALNASGNEVWSFIPTK
jgi:outer membrane protein assembly factor BamB